MVYQGPRVEAPLPPAVAGPAFLSDGAEVWVRPVQASDRDIVLDLLEREAPEPRRLATARPALTQEEILAPASPDERLCLLVLGDHPDRVAVLGLGEYVRPSAGSPVAEVAFLVGGPFRDQGIATLLLARLARAALAFGIQRFEARVRAENPEMLEVFRGTGVAFTEEPADGEVDLLIPLAPEVATGGAALVGKAPAEDGSGVPCARREGGRPASGRHRVPAARSRL
jgi:RimJ/RimL family protein N-acetyltransferase